MEYQSVLIIGGTGFIGSHIVAKLADTGCRVTVPTRRESHAQHLQLLPDVELIIEANVHDDVQLRNLIRGQDAVINLVGILHGKPASSGASYGQDFAQTHVELPKRIVAACAELGVHRYLHMSALGAAPDAPSMYLRSKADGEAAAMSNPAVRTTIFRPSVVFGDHDHFLNMFASLQKLLPVMLLANPDAKFQPVFVQDVAQAFVAALYDDQTIGKTYELAGPKVYSLRELVEVAGTYSGHPRPVVGMPHTLARLQAFILEHLPGDPIITRDNLDSMKIDNVAHGPMAEELHIEPTPLEAVAPYYLRGLQPHGPVDSVHVAP